MSPLTPKARLAVLLCDVAARALPEGARKRYVEEWRADLSADPAYSLRYPVSILAHVVVLRLSLSAMVEPGPPLRCRLHLHHYVTIHDNAENRQATSHRCTRCGRIADVWRGGGWPGRINVSERDWYPR